MGDDDGRGWTHVALLQTAAPYAMSLDRGLLFEEGQTVCRLKLGKTRPTNVLCAVPG